jgi:hypothetical protein
MAQPNALNPKFDGMVQGVSFEATHGNGVSTTAQSCNGSTAAYLFGAASTGAGFRGTVTGAWVTTLGATAQTITLKGTGGLTICTFTSSDSVGGVVGPNAVLANTAIDLSGSVSIVSGNTGYATDTSIVYITYKCDED